MSAGNYLAPGGWSDLSLEGDDDSDLDEDDSSQDTSDESSSGSSPTPPAQNHPDDAQEEDDAPAVPPAAPPAAPPADGDDDTSPADPDAGDPDVGGLTPVTNAYTGSHPLLNGETVDMAGLKGRPTVIYVWAPNCKVCNSRASELLQLKRDTDGIRFMTMASADKSLDELNAFVEQYKLTKWSNIDDRQGVVAAAHGVTRANSWVLIDADGNYEVRSGGRIADVQAWAAQQ